MWDSWNKWDKDIPFFVYFVLMNSTSALISVLKWASMYNCYTPLSPQCFTLGSPSHSLSIADPYPKNKRDRRSFISVNRLPRQSVCELMFLVLLWCVYVCKASCVLGWVCVVCACAVNKGAAERWLSPRDLQAPRILHLPRLMTELSSSVWAGTGWDCRQRQTRLLPPSPHRKITCKT